MLRDWCCMVSARSPYFVCRLRVAVAVTIAPPPWRWCDFSAMALAIFRLTGAGLGQCTTHTTLREPQHLPLQTLTTTVAGSSGAGQGNLPAPAPVRFQIDFPANVTTSGSAVVCSQCELVRKSSYDRQR